MLLNQASIAIVTGPNCAIVVKFYYSLVIVNVPLFEYVNISMVYSSGEGVVVRAETVPLT